MPEQYYERGNFQNSQLEFLETKSSGSENLTLSEVLQIEKEQWGNDISLINIIQQTKTTQFLFIFHSTEHYYVYDVVRNKPKFSQSVKINNNSDSLSKLTSLNDSNIRKSTFKFKNSTFEIYPRNLESRLDWTTAKTTVALLGDGWRMPESSEFAELHKTIKSDLVNGIYWTNTEDDEDISEVFIIENSKTKSELKYKSDKCFIRPIKKITE
jgi:hypothetical protein